MKRRMRALMPIVFGIVTVGVFNNTVHANINELVTVSARFSWSGATTSIVTAGTFLTISVDPRDSWVSGRWLVNANGTEMEGARLILPEEPAYSLIARVGDSGTPFFVGTMSEVMAMETGALQFSMNDFRKGFEDNSGSLLVTVVETPAPDAATLGAIGLALALWAKRRFH